VAVSGASGFIGSALVAALRRNGANLLRLVRREARAPDEIAWDPATGRIDASRLEGVTEVVHLAGENIAGGRWTEARKRRILESRVRGTTQLAEALAGLQRPPTVWVSASAIGFYGDRGDAVLTETEPPGTGFLTEVVGAWERAADPARRAGIRVVHPRFGVMLHPSGGMLKPVLLPFRLGLGARLGAGRQWMSWVSLRDGIGIIRFLLEQREAHGPLNATSPAPVTNAEFTSALARALHRPAWMVIPRFLLELVLGDLARETLLESTRAVPSRLTALGYRFQDPELQPALDRMLNRIDS
jgi:hypothetical protein